MRVGILTTVGENCGIAAYTRELVASLDGIASVEVEPISVGRQPVEHYREQANRLNQADVIHIQHEHSFWGGIMPGHSAFWELRYLLEKPVVITAHTTTSLAELFRVKDERKLHRKLAKLYLIAKTRYRDSVEIAPFITGRCIVHTEEGRRELIERGASPQYVHLIPAGVPDPFPAPTNGKSFRERFGLRDRRLITLFGYTTPNKGYELVFDAMPRLPDDVSFVIAGGPRNADTEVYAARLQADVSARGLNQRVVYTGFLNDEEVAEAMAASEIVLTPHTQATGSYSVMIPLTYGKPLIASDLAIFREIRERGACLELFPNRDSVAFATVVNRLLADSAARDELGRNALAYAGSHSWAQIARQTADVYQESIADVARLAHHP